MQATDFCRAAAEKARRLVQLLPGAGKPGTRFTEALSADNFSLIGSADLDFCDTYETAEKPLAENGNHLASGRLEIRNITAYPITAGVCLVTADCLFRPDAEENETELRVTLIFEEIQNTPLCAHLHISVPWTLPGKEENFAWHAGQENYRLLKEKSAQKSDPPRGELTQRQKRVLYFLKQGLGYQEIGNLLGISARTVRAHVAEIETRYGVENKSQLLAAAARETKL